MGSKRSMSTLFVPHHTLDIEENSRDREGSMKKQENGMNDIEMVVSSSLRESRKGHNLPLSGIPLAPMSPLGETNKCDNPDSLQSLKKEHAFDYNDDRPNKNELAIQSNHINDEHSSSKDKECTNEDLIEHENDSISSSDKQYRNFNLKI